MYEELAELVEKNKTALAEASITEAQARKLETYVGRDKNEIVPVLAVTISMVARYLHTGDPAEYRNYIHDLTLGRLEKGFSVDDIIVVYEIVTERIEQLMNEQFTAPEQIRQKERYLRRLQGIRTLGQTTLVAAQFDFNKGKH